MPDDDENIQSRRQKFFSNNHGSQNDLAKCLQALNRLYVSENGLVEQLLKLVTDLLLTSSVIPWKSDAPKGVYKNVLLLRYTGILADRMSLVVFCAATRADQ